jgi:peptidyl-prolyl cis-trans isomerase D
MLEAIRRGTTSFVAKFLLGILMLSFAVWGIADVFRGFGQGSVATIGEAEISAVEFDRQLRSELDSIARETGQPFSFEDARRQGYDRLILSKMIGQAALREHARELGLGLSQDDVVAGLRADPAFAGPDGKFSRQGLESILRQLRISESQFLDLRRDDDLRRHFSSAILSATVTPRALIDIAHAYNNETRTISFFRIDAEKTAPVPAPDDAKLQSHYEANKFAFMTPEYRSFTVIVASIPELKKEIEISDDELKKAYEESKETYDTPERRRIQQIPFKDKASAAAARDAIEKGVKNFMDVAKEQGAKESDVNLGMLAKNQLIDSKIADTVFALERDALSEVIEGRFATVLVRVIEIEPGRKSTFEEAKSKVKEKLADARAAQLLQERADLVEEALNAGKAHKDIASELKLQFFDIAAASEDNKTPEGATALDMPTPERVLRAVFRTEPGAQTEPVEIGSDGYAWYEVRSIEAPKQKPFEAVRDEVRKDYIDSERRNLVKAVADKLVERAKNGEDFAKLAEEAGGTLDKLEDILRNMSPPGLTQEAVELAFTLPLHGAASALTVDRGTRTVMKIDAITPAAPPSKSDEDKLVNELQQELQNDMLIAYVTSLQNRLGVTINEREVRRVTGADVAQP